ncbi:hypothetical protein DRP04_03725, partial [Archaeoglobales archaeon]
MNKALEAAKWYYSVGLKPLPVKQNRKAPALNSWKEWQEKTPTELHIKNWFLAGGNIAVLLGKGVREGEYFVGLDFDRRDFMERAFKEIPELRELVKDTYTDLSGFRHLPRYIFKTDKPIPSLKIKDPELLKKAKELRACGDTEEAKRVIKEAELVDIQGIGTIMVVPPSIVKEDGKIGKYKWIHKIPPKFVEASRLLKIIEKLKALAGIKEEVKLIETPKHVKEHGVKAFPEMPPCLHSLLNGVPEGMRNDSAFLLASFLIPKIGADLATQKLLGWNARNKPPLDEKELLRTIKQVQSVGYDISCRAIKSRLPVDDATCKGCRWRKILAPMSELRELQHAEFEEKEVLKISRKEFSALGLAFPHETAYAVQFKATAEILKAFDKNKHVILKMPTGCGKTAIFLTLCKHFAPAIVVEPQRNLQDQIFERYGRVMPLAVLKGKANYVCSFTEALKLEELILCNEAPCQLADEDGEWFCPLYNKFCTGVSRECEKEGVVCPCRTCSYRAALHCARETLLRDGIVIVNQGNWWLFRDDVEFVVVDEFEEVLSNLAKPVRFKYASDDNKLKAIENELEETRKEIKELREELQHLEFGKERREKFKKFHKLQCHLARIELLKENLDAVYLIRDEKGLSACYYPDRLGIIVRRLFKTKTLFVSATAPQIDGVEVVEIGENVIPKERRPILYIPLERVTRRQIYRFGKEWIFKAIAEAIKLYFNVIETEKAIVHVRSALQYGKPIAKHLAGSLKTKLRDPVRSIDKELKEFLEGDYQVFIADALGVGADFKGDDLKLQFVAQLAYPDLADPKVAALREDPEFKDKFDDWYNEEAIRQLVQVCGRICRGPDDFGIT